MLARRGDREKLFAVLVRYIVNYCPGAIRRQRLVSGLPRAIYYYHTKHQTQADKYEEIKAKITVIYHENKGRYGRRITTELCRHGFRINHKTVQRLMKELGLFCRVRMEKYKSFRGEVGEKLHPIC